MMAKIHKFRLISDGTGQGTRLLDENGDDVIQKFGIFKIVWEIDTDNKIGIIHFQGSIITGSVDVEGYRSLDE